MQSQHRIDSEGDNEGFADRLVAPSAVYNESFLVAFSESFRVSIRKRRTTESTDINQTVLGGYPACALTPTRAHIDSYHQLRQQVGQPATIISRETMGAKGHDIVYRRSPLTPVLPQRDPFQGFDQRPWSSCHRSTRPKLNATGRSTCTNHTTRGSELQKACCNLQTRTVQGIKIGSTMRRNPPR